MMSRPGLLGTPNPRSDLRGQSNGGILPSIRPHYHPATARALAELAERTPPWPEFLRERARILNDDRKTSERTERR